jgi:hypothetical protein
MRDVVRQATTTFPLLRRLEALVEAEAARPLTNPDRDALESGIRRAILVYEGTKFATELAFRSTLHELAEPLARVVALLEDEANRDAILVALGAPEWLAIHGRFSVDPNGTPIGDDLDEQREAAARHEILLDNLRAIARAVRTPPEGRKRGRPRTAKSFHDFVNRLATCWERASGTPFRQVNRPEQFVYAVVEFVESPHLKQLPKMIERIVAERRAQISEK